MAKIEYRAVALVVMKVAEYAVRSLDAATRWMGGRAGVLR